MMIIMMETMKRRIIMLIVKYIFAIFFISMKLTATAELFVGSS